MRYRIDFVGDRNKSMFLNSRKELTDWLKLMHPNTIEDVRKLYANGYSETIMDLSYVSRIINREN